jgi:alcohol dehydrogenase class IV
LPYTIKFNIPAAPERIASMLPYLSDENPTGTLERANKVVQVVRKLAEDLDVSLALKDYGISKEELKEVAEFIAKEQQNNYALPSLNPRLINQSNMIALFDDMWQGVI